MEDQTECEACYVKLPDKDIIKDGPWTVCFRCYDKLYGPGFGNKCKDFYHGYATDKYPCRTCGFRG